MSDVEDIEFIKKLQKIGSNQAYRDRHYLKTGRLLIMREVKDFWPDWVEAETKDLLTIAEHYSNSPNVILKTTMRDAKNRLLKIRKEYNRKIFTQIRQIANGKKIGKDDTESTQKFNYSLAKAVALVTEILCLRENITTAIKEALTSQEDITEKNEEKTSSKTKKPKLDSTPGTM